MKERIMAIILLVLVIGSVFLNSSLLCAILDRVIKKVEIIDLSQSDNFDIKKDVEKIYNEYQDYYLLIGLTVNHDDLTNIDDHFIEFMGYLSVNDLEAAKVAQSRLINSLKHLRRLCGFNIEAII